MVTLLAQIFVRTGRLPAEIMDLPRTERVLCLVAMRETLDAEAEQVRTARAHAARAGGAHFPTPRHHR